MSDYDDYCWTASDDVHRPGRLTFSLALLFRGVTLLCLAFGWIALVRFASPYDVQGVLITTFAVMAIIVGLRRHGRRLSRILAAVWFCGLGLFVAAYSAIVACVVQLPAERSVSRWDGLDQMILGVALLLVAPVVIAALVFMTRAWTWSAYDHCVHQAPGFKAGWK